MNNIHFVQSAYPYEWMDDPEKFKETQLPPIKAFYSKLRLSGISKPPHISMENAKTGRSADDTQYEYHCLRMMNLFNEYFQLREMIINTNPLDSKRLHDIMHQQRTCLAMYNEHNTCTQDYESRH